jgi:TetR/AcrR family transcriptional regulator
VQRESTAQARQAAAATRASSVFPHRATRTRDAERTRTAILNAAEELFGANGYRGTSLQQIGAAAGYSRGAPGYFYGSKKRLYAAVVERILQRTLEAFPKKAGHAANGNLGADGIRDVVARYLDFLVSEPTFVRLMHAEILAGAEAATRRAVEILHHELKELGMVDEIARRLTLTIAALCCFPAAHGSTVAKSLGIDVYDAEMRRAYTDYVTAVALGESSSSAERARRPLPK